MGLYIPILRLMILNLRNAICAKDFICVDGVDDVPVSITEYSGTEAKSDQISKACGSDNFPNWLL